MRDGDEKHPPSKPMHRAVGNHSEAIGQSEAGKDKQRPEDAMHPECPLPPPVHDRHFGERHIADSYEQRHSAHGDENEQREEEGERPIPPSPGNDFAKPRINVAKPLTNRGKLLLARVKPLGQCGREDMPSVCHDDDKHGNGERTHTYAQSE